MTALAGPVLASYSDARARDHDNDWVAIPVALGFLVVALLLVVMFLPAMREVAAHAPAARHVWVGTLWFLCCLGLAYLLATIADPAALVAFPVCAVASVMGAIRINERLAPT